MWVTVCFTNTGTPATGLSPTIRIRDLSDNSLVVTDAAMTEVGDGWYKYDFTTYDNEKDYAIRCDGTATLSGSDRYAFVGSAEVNMDDKVTTIRQVLTGKWEIVGNQLLMYDDDDTTVLYTFDLSRSGSPTEFNPTLRDPA